MKPLTKTIPRSQLAFTCFHCGRATKDRIQCSCNEPALPGTAMTLTLCGAFLLTLIGLGYVVYTLSQYLGY